MKTKKQSCCFCYNIALEGEGNVVNSNILVLLKFLVVNVDTNSFENSTVCNNCLNSILEICEYKKRNSLKMVKSKNEIDSETSTMCQKCKKNCGQGDSFRLMDCITQIERSDFVNYLFVDQDTELLESSQICNSCRISLSKIQEFLKLIYVYDQSKMKCEISNCNEIKEIKHENFVKIEIKNECGNFNVNDKTAIGDSYITYADFKCKNEEVELKLEYDDQPTYQYEKVDVDKEMTSSDSFNMIKSNNEELGMNSQGFSNRLIYDNIQDFKCIYCSKVFTKKCTLGEHLIRKHKCRDGVTSKILDCDKCSYLTTIKGHILRHKLKHSSKERFVKYKCYNCVYQTYNKTCLISHVKKHNIVRDFKCTFCSKEFVLKTRLEDHLVRIHKSDNVTGKIHKCDECSYETTIKNQLLQHKLKHDIKIKEPEKHKCQHCTFETYNKSYIVKHVNKHYNVRDFKCIFCSKEFVNKTSLDDHLLKVHKCKDNITSKIHKCDKCSYETAIKRQLLNHNLIRHTKTHNHRDFKCTFCSKQFSLKPCLDDHLVRIHKSYSVTSKIHKCDQCSFASINKSLVLRHKVKHGIKVEGLKKHKCQRCIYETYNKSHLIEHMKFHDNIRDFKCTLCSKEFSKKVYLDSHLISVHKNKDHVTSKIYGCDKCNYETAMKSHLLKHILTHGIK